jgi:hypothetical protein
MKKSAVKISLACPFKRVTTCSSGDHDCPVPGAVNVAGVAELNQPAGYQAQVDQDEQDVEREEGGVVPAHNSYFYSLL